MKKNELEQRIGELSELRVTLEKTLSMSTDELKKLESSSEDVLKYLSDISMFAKETIEKSHNLSHDDKIKFLEANVSKLVGWTQSESDRIRQKPQLISERIATLQSVISHINERYRSHEARIIAIDRAADPNRDKKHPEKLSVKRAAQELNQEE